MVLQIYTSLEMALFFPLLVAICYLSNILQFLRNFNNTFLHKMENIFDAVNEAPAWLFSTISTVTTKFNSEMLHEYV